MWRKDKARQALAGRIRTNRLLFIVTLVAVVASLVFLWHGKRPARYHLRMTAGDPLGHRNDLAEILRDEAKHYAVDLELVPTSGGDRALELVAAGKLDVAMIAGLTSYRSPELREVIAVLREPLHLFVRNSISIDGGADALRGKRLNLGTKQSDTRLVAERVLTFMGLESGRDYEPSYLSFLELTATPTEQLPDGIFVVAPLPATTRVGLARRSEFHMFPLPFGEAMSLREGRLHPAEIPAFTYGFNPPIPPAALPTVATPTLIVAHRDVPEVAIGRLLSALFENEFSRRANLPALTTASIDPRHDFPLHRGTQSYLRRKDPLLTIELIDGLENLRSFLASGALAAFLLWRWWRARRLLGFEIYFDQVTEIEQEALALESQGGLTEPQRRQLRQRLSGVKSTALESFAEGHLPGGEQLVGFLTHARDVHALIDAVATRTERNGQPESPAPAPPLQGTSAAL
ncbi:MAG: TAXI family TRAP transporter solute-binding subunit [Pirellulales bacterium]